MRVSFLIAGAQKGGTTALTSYLRQHPRLCLAGVKETHFFDTEEYFGHSPVNYALLHAHFHPEPGQLLGEATPITMYWADAPRRVWEYNSAMKLICVLRNPVDRAYSHWNMERSRGADDLPFGEAIRSEAERCSSARPLQHRVYSYIDRGFYSEQVRRLWRFFPPAQTLLLRSDELRGQPRETLDQVFDFLGVERVAVDPRVAHALEYLTPMSLADRAYLTDLFQWEVRELERLLGWDCASWLNPPALEE